MLEKKGKLQKFLRYPQDCNFLNQIPVRSYQILSDPIRSYQILSDPIRSYQILSDPIRSYQYLNLIQSLLDLLAIVHCKSIIYSMSIPYEMTSGRFSRDNLIKSLIVTFVWKRQLVWSQRFLFRIKICNPTNQAEDAFVLNC